MNLFKHIKDLRPALLFMLAILFNSCKEMSGLYTAGMGYGLFTALAFLVVIVFIVMKIRKR